MDDGEEKIGDPEIAAALKRRARRIYAASLLTAALLTAGSYLLAG